LVSNCRISERFRGPDLPNFQANTKSAIVTTLKRITPKWLLTAADPRAAGNRVG
jgi:hypothetical protein